MDNLPLSNDRMSPGIWRFAEALQPVAPENRVTLGEGNTPLVKSVSIARQLGVQHLYFKLESGNPTGSYKDRISALGVSRALELGKKVCVGTSSGNAGASVAAYAARAGLTYRLLVLEQIVEAKLLQASAYGADIVKIRGFGESAEIGERVFAYIERQARLKNWQVMITAYRYNPEAMEGVKTISFELYHDLNGRFPDAVFVPVGGGGLCLGVMRGFRELRERWTAHGTVSIVAVQPEGCSNVVRAFARGRTEPEPGDSTSRISGLQVPNPPDGRPVLEGLLAGEGWAEAVPDESAWKWQEKLAAEEGILCEPAAAITLAGLERSVRSGRIRDDAIVVCVITGAGYKDGDRLKDMFNCRPAIPLCDIDELERESGTNSDELDKFKGGVDR